MFLSAIPSGLSGAASSDPFSFIPIGQENQRAVQFITGRGSTSEYSVEATQVQKDICQEPFQWATAELALPHPSPSFQDIGRVWNTLASYHACLRACAHTDVQTGAVSIRVNRRIENIVPSESVRPVTDDASAHLIWHPAGFGGNSRVTLRFRRAVIDATSVDIIKTDFLLILFGLPPLDRLSFVFHSNFVRRTKNPEESAAFWHDVLTTSESVSALRTPLLPGNIEATERRHLSFQPPETLLLLLGMVPDSVARQTLFEMIWSLVLSQHSGSEDVVFGVVGRDESFFGAEATVGCLDQTYLLRVPVSPMSTVEEINKAIKNCKMRAAQHAFIGLPAILEHLPEGQVVESALNYTKAPAFSCLAPGLGKFPIVMSISGWDHPTLTISYIRDIADADAQTLLDHFVTALAGTLSKDNISECLLQDIPLISESEKAILAPPSVKLINDPPTLPELIEASVRSHPSRLAVVFEDQASLSYQQLNDAANGLGRLLGLAKGEVVPLLIDRSANLIIALLAILKSGATYTILNPDVPKERNAQIIQECSPRFILANRKYSHLFPSTVSIEGALAEAAAFSGPDNSWSAESKPSPDDASYIIYTSGSTGKPKGTVVTHRAAASGITRHPSLEDMPRVLLFWNPTASAAQRTLISTLAHSGTMVIASIESIFTDLAGVINKYQVDQMEITPTALSVLQPSSIPAIKQITLAGESIPQALVDTWSAVPNLIIRNRFGTSECTQLSFGRRLRANDNSRNLGAPTDTTLAYILRPGSNELAPVGVAGELCLSGPQLASGYLNEPALTEKAFVRNPLGGDGPYARLYRTGDAARKLPDGSIEIMGRIDWQLKINGNKVEPADVDQAISQHQSVAACVTFGAEVGGNLTLVAAVVPKQGELPWSELLPLLRRHALGTLPSYMIPSLWMPLDELPRSANGKADLKTLRSRAIELGVHGFSSFTASGSQGQSVISDPVERQIANAWASALGIQEDAIGLEHSFLALGGSSLQAIRVIAKLREQDIVVDFRSLLTDMPLHEVASKTRESTVGPAYTEPFTLVDDVSFVNELKGVMDLVDAYPATPLQSALLSTLNTDDDPYVYRRIWEVGGLDFEKLKHSFCRVFDTSDILRTGFVPHGHSYVQFVRADVGLPWSESDLTVEEYIKKDCRIDLPLHGPLFRIGLVRGQWLVVTMHHALCDFWSHKFIYEDVAAAYHDQAIPTRPRFAGYVSFTQQLDRDAAQAFWTGYLAEAPKSNLNPARPDELHLKPEGTSKSVALDLHGRTKLLGIAPGAVVSAAWAVVLSQHQNSQDVMFATTLSGRDAPVPGIERMDGPTLLTVPQRIAIRPGMSLISLVKDVCTASLIDINQHAHVGMQGALKAAGLSNDCFDTLVNILPAEETSEAFTQTFRRNGDRSIWKTPYTLLEVIADGPQTTIRMSGEMELRRLQFLCDSFVKAVLAILDTPEQLVSKLDVLTDTEHRFLRNEVSNLDTLVTPAPSLLHADFERCAQSEPGRVAINWTGTVQVSYASLNGRANHVAAILVEQGLQTGDCVALMLDKSIEAVVCILGVLKAGCTYVPLSPDNPIERNAFVCRDTSAKFIILQNRQQDLSCHLEGTDVMVVEDIEPLEGEAPTVVVTPEHIAYIIYTSGSTGQPKGIRVPHQAVSSAIKSACDIEGRSKGEWRVLQMSNYVFDVSILDIFNTLSTGGTLCMAPTSEVLSDMAGYMNRMGVRQVAITPTVAGLLQPNDVPNLETLILAGESVSKSIIDRWTPFCRVLNSYGPTETSILVCTKEIRGSHGPAGNIGAPYPTVTAFILDPEGDSLRPYGAVGELCIGGPQLSDGYVGRDDLTAAVFVWNESLKLRVYRTGDLARWLPGGEVECLGRKDNQVKINGFRVELGEIEAVIRESGLVADVAVILATINNKQQLVAACMFKSSAPLGTAEQEEPAAAGQDLLEAAEKHADDFQTLRQRLGSLAYYMLPKLILPMARLPLMPSHKVDRKRLQATVEKLGAVELSPYVMEAASDGHKVVPTETPLEQALELMWVDVLGVPAIHIGREANFLSLGGDSVSAISLSSVARQMGYSLAVPTILRVPKLHELAAQMAILPRGNGLRIKPVFETPEMVKVETTAAGLDWEKDVDYVYPCPPGQVEFLKQGKREEQAWVLQTVRRMPATADQELWIRSTTALSATNEILRTSWLQVSEMDWVGLVLRSTELDLRRVSCKDEAEAAPVIESLWNERFVFPQPFIRYIMITYPDGAWDLVTKMDHAVYDGTLLRIFDEHYAAILRDQPSPRHTTFKDFAFHIFEKDKSSSLDYWKKRLHKQDESDFLKQAAWANAPAPVCNSVVKRPIPKTDVDQLASDLGVTPAILFQGAFQLWLSQATASRDVSFDYLLTGRNVDLPNPQTINGTTANFLPMRIGIDPKERLISYLQRTQDDFWEMTDHGDVGLDQIYEAAGLDRQTVSSRVLFIYQPFDPAPANDPDADFRWLVMAKSKVRLLAPYTLVVEVHKTPDRAFALKMSYDDAVLDQDAARTTAEDIIQIIEKMVASSSGDIMEKQVENF